MAVPTAPPVAPTPYKHQDYPAWRYSESARDGVLVKNAAAEKALGAGWHDTPADVPAAASAVAEDAAPKGKDKPKGKG